MGWLDPQKVLTMAGYPPPASPAPVPAASLAALAFAEQAIEHRTRCLWGSSLTETVTVRLSAAAYLLRLPRDTTEVATVTPAVSAGAFTQLGQFGLEIYDSAWDQLPWRQGTYRVELTRGIVEIPEAVNRAGALLAAHYLSLPDPERSRYDEVVLGDFAGTERRDAFPVPAAEQLLRPWIATGVGVG